MNIESYYQYNFLETIKRIFVNNSTKLNSQLFSTGGKILWSLAPMFWGTITWLLAYGPGNILPISYPIRLLCGIMLVALFFYRPLNYAATHYKISLFEYSLPLPNWKPLTFVTVLLLLIYSIYALFFSWDYSPVFSSIVFGVFASACIEELLTRAFFIKYSMSSIQFIIFNLISSTSFALMHAGYEQPTPSLYDLFITRGHFHLSFLYGIIAYKTKRIEITMLLHIGSNFFRYTLPFLILKAPLPLVYPLYGALELLLLGGLHKITKNKLD